MGKAIIRVTPELVIQYLKNGTIELNVEVSDGIPDDAEIMDVRLNRFSTGASYIEILVESESLFPGQSEAALVPMITPRYTRVADGGYNIPTEELSKCVPDTFGRWLYDTIMSKEQPNE